MKNQLNEGELLVNRVKLLMSYDMSKTLNENTQTILEQPDSRFDNPETKDILNQGQKELDRQKAAQDAEEELNKYTNWCRYPDKAVAIPKNPEGAEGNDSILTDPKSGKRFCYYSSPSTEKPGSIESLPIPEDSKIVFWDVPEISRFVDFLIKKYPKIDKEQTISNLSKILPIGAVEGFYIGNDYYSGYITRKNDSSIWKFGYYRNRETKKPYTPPKWVDKRNDWQQFIDEWGMWLQLGGVVVSIIAGFFTFGTTWGISTTLLIELLYEAGIGGQVAWREYEKGNNVSAVASIIFAALPLLKTRNWFKGINKVAFAEVSEKMLASGLNKSSTVRDYVKFYGTLSEDGKKIVSQMLSQDKYTQEVMWKSLKTELDAELPKLITKGAEKLLKKHPDMFVKLSAFEKLWVRELSMAHGPLIAANMIIEHFFGETLNNEEKQKIKQVYQVIPEELQKELTYNLVSNPTNIKEIINSTEFKEIINKKEDKFVKNIGKWYYSKVKSAVESTGTKWKDLSEKDIEQSLNKDGWIKRTPEIKDDQVIDSRLINGVEWVKI